MVERRGGVRFALETLEREAVLGQLFGQKLERHKTSPSLLSSAWYTTPLPPPPSFSKMR